MPPLFWLVFGILFAVVLAGTFLSVSYTETSEKRTLIQRIGSAGKPQQKARPSRVILEHDREAAAADSFLQRLPFVRLLARQIAAAGLDWQPGPVLLSMLGLALVGAFAGMRLRLLIFPALSAAGLGLFLASLPYQIIVRKRAKRFEAFEAQFPDTLDFIARAITAGHALSVSLEMLANDSPEPTRTEFRRVFTEHNLGAPLDMALTGLVERVPLVDARFFVSAVLIQRETGGNLGEILNNLGDVIRERFMLKGKVKAAAAHGKMTAKALTLIPIVVLLGLALVNPEYLTPLREDRHGRYMALGAIIGQVAGYLAMKKIIDIKV